ncbi:MAG: transcriptional regulator, TetR family [Acidobacteria bacterium]|nr:transcriptional regulator, TetR family [Acidobacteriota bacterium]
MILDAARELFATEGYEAVTMRRIADRIEYSPTAIYFHFKDKESLVRELCDADFLTLAHQFHRIARIADPLERLRQAGIAYMEFGLEKPNHYRLMFMTPHPAMAADESAIERGNPEVDAYAFLKAIIVDSLAQKKFRKELTDADLIAQTVWAGVHGAISLQIAKCNDDWVDWRDMKKRMRFMVDLLVKGLEK